MYEFAAKLAGMSRDQVDLVLRLEKRLQDKPVLRDALISGDVSANKLARVVSIASVENQQNILGKVEALSNRALEVFVKDFKNQNGLMEARKGDASLHVQTFESNLDLDLGPSKDVKIPQIPRHECSLALDIELDEDVKNELIEMKKKGIDVSQILREFLLDRKEKMQQKKLEVVENQLQERQDRATIGMPANRYVPVEVKRIVINEFGKICSAPGCSKLSKNLHHEKGFAIDQCHDPRFLKPLCIGHHELAHAENT